MDFRSRDREPLTIDRDLDLAVSEFAPGFSENKRQAYFHGGRLHGAYSKSRRRLLLTGDNSSTLRRWMARCERLPLHANF